MSKKRDETASFMVRFNQKIFEEDGESKVQWRGKISHVQGGEEQNFSDFNDALLFMRDRLANLTKEATKDKTTEQQEGILQKSLYMWKTMKEVGPKVLMETIKDPKKQLHHISALNFFCRPRTAENTRNYKFFLSPFTSGGFPE